MSITDVNTVHSFECTTSNISFLTSTMKHSGTGRGVLLSPVSDSEITIGYYYGSCVSTEMCAQESTKIGIGMELGRKLWLILKIWL